MKRMILVLMTLAALLYAFPAHAQTQEQFELSCTAKIAANTEVYLTADDDWGAIDSLNAGAYVQLLDTSAEDWKEILYMVDGVTYRGWVQGELESCLTTIRTNGFVVDVHEKDPCYSDRIDALENDW